MFAYTQWRSKGEVASGGTRPGAQALGAQQHTFCSPLKTCFKQKFRPKYANTHFWRKTIKIASATGAPPPNPRYPHAVTPACYYNFFAVRF